MPNGRTHSLRDKHPARSARILTTGISITSVLGLTSAYSIAAQQTSPASGNETIASTPKVAQSVTPSASEPAIAPTQPAPATPAPVVALTQSSPAAQLTAAVAPITIMVLTPDPPATRSSGSK